VSASGTRQAFLDAAANKHIAGAYLVVCSRPGVAARLTDSFLTRLFCREGGCGRCPACIKVRRGHVDILRLAAPKVDEFRDAISFLSQRPVEGAFKAVVIADADNMTTQAANSMLKTLEEPPSGTVIVLQARSVSGVLPTIASRCGAVYLSPEPGAADRIASALGVDRERARVLADLSGGYIEEARRLQENEAFWPLRNEMLTLTGRLMHQKNRAINTYVQFFEKNAGKSRAETSETITMLLDLMAVYCRDIAVYQKTQNPALIASADFSAPVRKAADHFTSGAISNMIRIILETQRRFLSPVNVTLAMENMLFNILEELDRWKKSSA